MLAHCGLPVLNLKRLAYGACTLGGRPQHVEMRSRYDLDTGDCLARFLHRIHAYYTYRISWSMHTGHRRSQSRLLYHCIRLQPGEARCATPAERRWACELLEATARADRCASTGAIAAGVV